MKIKIIKIDLSKPIILKIVKNILENVRNMENIFLYNNKNDTNNINLYKIKK